jgi:hypothetical protein
MTVLLSHYYSFLRGSGRASPRDFVPFLCAGGLALNFTVLLVLLAEDDSNNRKVLCEQQS